MFKSLLIGLILSPLLYTVEAQGTTFHKRQGAWQIDAQPIADQHGRRVRVRFRNDTAATDFDVELELARVVIDVSVFGNSRATFIAEGTESDVVAIVDLISQKVVDSFYCYRPSLSPTGRFVTFVAYYHRSDAVGPDLVRAYDVTKSPNQNRYVDVDGPTFQAGLSVYPLSSRDAARYRDIQFTASNRPVLRSPMTWVDANTVVFVAFDGEAAAFKVVLLTFDETGGAVRFAGLVRTSIVDDTRIPAGFPLFGLVTVQTIQVVSHTPSATRLRIVFDGDPWIRESAVEIDV